MSNRIPQNISMISDALKDGRLAKLEPLAVRVVTVVTSPLFAGMDSFYHCVGAITKLALVGTRGTVWVVTGTRYGYFAPDIKLQTVGAHLYKATTYFRSIFTSPVTALYSPEKLVESYRQRDLIVSQPPPQFTLEREGDVTFVLSQESPATAPTFVLSETNRKEKQE